MAQRAALDEIYFESFMSSASLHAEAQPEAPTLRDPAGFELWEPEDESDPALAETHGNPATNLGNPATALSKRFLAGGFSERKLAVLSYDTPLRMGSNDVMFKLRAPGDRRSIVTFKLEF